jgi:glycosyltransferase involved in cell wall biosynthesis
LPTLDLLLFPSRHMEGFGLPVLEASLAGVPSVISRIPSLTCFEEAGMPSVHPEDAEGFADAVEQILFNRPKWREERKKALRSSRSFTPARTRHALLTSLKDLGYIGEES